MTCEVWFRNPSNYVQELVEAGEYLIAWDYGFLLKKKIDPIKHANLYYGTSMPWRALVVTPDGSAEYIYGDTTDTPQAVYPTWSYSEDDTALLLDILENPVGEDSDACNNKSVSASERPVLGQPHRVIITDLPYANTGPGKRFLVYLKELQEDYPACTIHVHGLYGFRPAFGLGFKAADMEPRTPAQKGKIILPSGKEVPFERGFQMPKWIKLLGYNPADLSVPRNRCIYNIRSAKWAAENYERLYKFRISEDTSNPIDFMTPASTYVPSTSGVPILTRGIVPKEGDQFSCDTCSLQDDCKYYRKGAVCGVPGAEPTNLSRMFKSRDADVIIDGLGAVLGAQAKRAESGMKLEEAFGEIDPQVSKDLNTLFNNGVKLAKLLDPGLRGGGTKVQVNVGEGAVQIQTPQQVMGAAIRELEARGIPRENITSEMVMGLLEGMANEASARRAIEGTVVSKSTEPEERAS